MRLAFLIRSECVSARVTSICLDPLQLEKLPNLMSQDHRVNHAQTCRSSNHGRFKLSRKGLQLQQEIRNHPKLAIPPSFCKNGTKSMLCDLPGLNTPVPESEPTRNVTLKSPLHWMWNGQNDVKKHETPAEKTQCFLPVLLLLRLVSRVS